MSGDGGVTPEPMSLSASSASITQQPGTAADATTAQTKLVVNEAAWTNLDEDEDMATANKLTSDKTWSEFKTRKQQLSIREQERLEKEEKLRRERKQMEEERRLEEERRKKEFEELEAQRRREQEEAELAAQRERERLRLAAKLEREKAGSINMTEQSMLMASFEEEVGLASVAKPPVLMHLFQYKPLASVVDAEEEPLHEPLHNGTLPPQPETGGEPAPEPSVAETEPESESAFYMDDSVPAIESLPDPQEEGEVEAGTGFGGSIDASSRGRLGHQ